MNHHVLEGKGSTNEILDAEMTINLQLLDHHSISMSGWSGVI